MKKTIVLILCSLFVSVFMLPVAGEEMFAGDGVFVVEPSDTIYQNLSVNEKDIAIWGVLYGNLIVNRGYVHLFPNALVKGNVVLLNCQVEVDSGAEVEGNIVCVGGDLIIDESAHIKGNKIVLSVNGKDLEKGLLKNIFVKHVSMKTLYPFILFWGIIFLITLFAMPVVVNSYYVINNHTLRCLLWGVLILILLFLTIISLVFSVVGIIVIPIILLFLIALVFLSMGIGVSFLGNLFMGEFKREKFSYKNFWIGVFILFMLFIGGDFFRGIVGFFFSITEWSLYILIFVLGSGSIVESIIRENMSS